jgi:ubiquinone/menaquinone biosynthesis C-methylase UbiE
LEDAYSRSAVGLDERELSEYYDARYSGDYMEGQPALEVMRVEQLLREAGQPRSVLDFGCGRGGWVALLESAFPGAEIVGVDISATAIEGAKASFPRHSFHTLGGDKVPLPDESVELVFSYHVLEHVLDVDAAVAEIARVLAPGGRAAVIFPCGNPGSLEERIVRRHPGGIDPVSGRFFHEDPSHLRRLTTADTAELFERQGMALTTDWHANQLWGGVDWLARVGKPATGELLRDRRALRLTFAVLTPVMQAYALARPVERIRSARGPAEKLRWTAALLAHALAYPVGRVVEGLARREWERDRGRPNGSAQYLLFEKR